MPKHAECGLILVMRMMVHHALGIFLVLSAFMYSFVMADGTTEPNSDSDTSNTWDDILDYFNHAWFIACVAAGVIFLIATIIITIYCCRRRRRRRQRQQPCTRSRRVGKEGEDAHRKPTDLHSVIVLAPSSDLPGQDIEFTEMTSRKPDPMLLLADNNVLLEEDIPDDRYHRTIRFSKQRDEPLDFILKTVNDDNASFGTIIVNEVFPDSAAARAGLQEGDVLISLNGMDFTKSTIEQALSVFSQFQGTIRLVVCNKLTGLIEDTSSEYIESLQDFLDHTKADDSSSEDVDEPPDFSESHVRHTISGNRFVFVPQATTRSRHMTASFSGRRSSSSKRSFGKGIQRRLEEKNSIPSLHLVVTRDDTEEDVSFEGTTDTTVGDLKLHLMRKLDIPIDCQILSYDGNILQPNHVYLASLDITNGSSILLKITNYTPL